ncbi:MAG: hypothetical protein H0W54_00340 [Rubrobacter sp.]|nr:hypothetical protein [Rubrobacter sp.]
MSPAGGLSFVFTMAGIRAVAMVGAYFTTTGRAHDGAPIPLGYAAGFLVTVALYFFVLPLLGRRVAPVPLLFLAAAPAYPDRGASTIALSPRVIGFSALASFDE